MIVDSHCHAWRRWPYDDRVPDRDHRGSAEALLYEMDRHGVERAVVVCARIGEGAGRNDDNNGDVAQVASRHPDRLVAFADVDCSWRPEHHTDGAADRLRAVVEGLGLVGFTHYVGPADDGWFRTDEGERFVAAAAELDLVMSLAAGPAWQPEVRRLAAAHPTLPLLLHHQGGLRLDSPTFDGDLEQVLETAQVPSVLVKVSGFHYLTTPPWDYPYTEAREHVTRRLHEAYGEHRLAWGSDFPAARPHLTYTQSLEVVRSRCTWLSAPGLAQVLGGTMAEVLRTRRPPAPPRPLPP